MKKSTKKHISRIVKEAIDSYPGGLCFSEPDGKPILVNKKMNALVSALTDRTVMDANITWEQLCKTNTHAGCAKLSDPWFKTADSNELVFRFPDNTVWHFKRQTLKNEPINTVQTEAIDITELYRISEELYENNLHFEQMRKRRTALLENLVEVNRDKELLSTKVRIHDELGHCLVAAKKALSTGTSDDEYIKLLDSWSEAISGMLTAPLQNTESSSAEEELQKVADLIGCRLEITGERPAQRSYQLLMYTAIREALTNAVRHGGATALKTQISRDKSTCIIKISNNGRPPEKNISEGGGLGNLRKTLEREGAGLSYSFEDGFALVISLPQEYNEEEELI